MEREIVTMLVEPHKGNEAGEVRIYRDELPEGAVVKGEGGNDVDVSRMNKAQLTEHLSSLGIELAGDETKAELLALAPE